MDSIDIITTMEAMSPPITAKKLRNLIFILSLFDSIDNGHGGADHHDDTAQPQEIDRRKNLRTDDEQIFLFAGMLLHRQLEFGCILLQTDAHTEQFGIGRKRLRIAILADHGNDQRLFPVVLFESDKRSFCADFF